MKFTRTSKKEPPCGNPVLTLNKATMSSKSMNGPAVVAMRRKLGISQVRFWRRVGVTASDGSRYERGVRVIPDYVKMLIPLAYGTEPKVALAQLRA